MFTIISQPISKKLKSISLVVENCICEIFTEDLMNNLSFYESKLEKIEDEVKELHPLLNNLFPKINGILRTEYTHGQSEKGADFILEAKKEIPLQMIYYIGVIVKSDIITDNTRDIHTIEEQVKKCLEQDYIFSNGRKKIRLNEIWIITSKRITNPAKNTIEIRFRSNNLCFYTGKDLAQLMLTYTPNYWIHESASVTNYLTTINKSIREFDNKIEIKLPDGKELYVQPTIYEEINYGDRDRKKKEIDIHKKIKEESFIMLEGKFGAGKSKLLRELCIYYSTPSVFEKEKIIPIYITFKELIENYDINITKLIKDNMQTDSIEDIEYLILIDAIDENKIDENIIIKHITFIKEQIDINSNIKVVATIRNLENLENVNEIYKITYVCKIAQFSLNQIINVIKQVCSCLPNNDRLFNDLKTSPLFKNMPKNPIVAILLANIIYSEERTELPSNLTELYSRYIEIVLGRWTKKHSHSTTIYIIIKEILQNRAQYMMDNNLDVISVDEVYDNIRQYCKQRNLEQHIDSLMEVLQNDCEIIFINTKNKTFSFKHKSFMEFLYAFSYATKEISEMTEMAFDPYWTTSVFFYLGIKPDRPNEIMQLMNYQPENNSFKRIVKILKLGDFLLAGYLTPYTIVENCIQKILVEFATFYLDIVNKKIINPFSAFPPMILLAFLRYYCRQTYSFEYFRKALENAFLRIHSDDIDDEIKMIALFFASITLIDLGVNKITDLLDEYIKTLRPDIRLAIISECKNPNYNKFLKIEEKRIIKNFNKTSKIGLKELFERSIISIDEIKKLEEQKK